MNNNVSVKIDSIDNFEYIGMACPSDNPLISPCKVKVMYVGENRNGSYISKAVAKEMAKTLPGCPIVGAWRKDVEDFGDHGEVIKIENGEISFSTKTVPYGFIDPYSELYFEDYDDILENGEHQVHTYIVAQGYLWTGQFPEAEEALKGKGQSMELDPSLLEGNWAYDNEGEVEFFIINDAVISKLCILGDDVEPCYEGAAIASRFSKEDESFAHRLFTMVQELNTTLSSEGGMMQKKNDVMVEDEVATDEVATEFTEVEPEPETAEVEEVVEETEVPEETEEVETEVEEPVEEASAEEETVEVEVEDGGSEQAEDNEPSEQEEVAETEDVYNELEESKAALDSLKAEFEKLKDEVVSLREFKLNVENQEKDALIAKYHMLSDEDKADVIANKEKYSLGDIEAKLALIYVNKNVDFDTVDGKPAAQEEEEASAITTFNLDSAVNSDGGAEDDLLSVLRSVR